ncbi:MAG TPA: RDD family protein, partial [Actinomycetota bacterium]|nr:RDD family protein [Actinomycetota bacterium]
SCGVEVPAGTRWCGICRSNALDPAIGRLASPGRRLGAHVLDVAVPLVAFLVISGVWVLGAGATEEQGSVGGVLGLGLFVAYAVWALRLFARGMTPGKRLLGIRVVREDGRPAGFGTMLLREWVGKAISGFLLGLGYLWILLDRDNQGWHDKLVRTYVVRSRPGGSRSSGGVGWSDVLRELRGRAG